MKRWEAGNTGRRASTRSVAEGGNLNDRAGTRTQDQRINLPQDGFPKDQRRNPLRLHDESLAHHLPTGLNQADADPNLADLVQAWPNLPPAAREAIMGMVKAFRPSGGKC